MGIIFKASFYMPLASLRILYYSMIYPYLQYCNIVWGSTYTTNLTRIILLQKSIIRILNRSKFDEHTSPLLKKFGLLTLRDICLLQLGQIMYCYRFSFLSERFNNMFLKVNQIHGLNTRKSPDYRVPLCRTNARQFFVYFQGPKFINSLPRDLVNINYFLLFILFLNYYIIKLFFFI